MSDSPIDLEQSATWQGDIIAGKIQSFNWSAELQVTKEKLILTGPVNMHYQLSAENVNEVKIAIGKFLSFSWRMKKTIRIVHSEPGITPVLAFRSRRAKATEIVSKLRDLGYNVVKT